MGFTEQEQAFLFFYLLAMGSAVGGVIAMAVTEIRYSIRRKNETQNR